MALLLTACWAVVAFAPHREKWRQPADADIGFENGRVIVTPNRCGASGFARIEVLED